MDKKILFVDNRPSYLETTSELLEEHGYIVKKAGTLDAAREMLEKEFFHLLISDIRMEDDNEVLDDSGIQFVHEPRWKDLPKIVITAYPSFENAEKVFGVVQGIVGKDDPVKLVTKTNEVFQNHVPVHWDLKISSDLDRGATVWRIASLLNPQAKNEEMLTYINEITFVFRGLFKEAEEVYITRILWRREHRIALVAHVFTPGRGPESLIVIVGNRMEMEQETRNFKTYVHAVTGFNTIAGDEVFKTYRLAAHTYRTVDGDLEELMDLKSCFQYGETEKVTAVLEDLFGFTLKAWHEGSILQRHEVKKWFEERLQRLSQGHMGRLDSNLTQLTLKLRSLGIYSTRARGQIQMRIGDQDLTFSDPHTFLAVGSISEIQGSWVNSPGYLYGDNILTDGERSTWLTNFYHAGPAPLVRDYVSIEAATRYDWAHLEPENALTLEYLLITDDFNTALPQVASGKGEKIRGTASLIRKMYADSGESVQAYHLGMFYHIIARLVELDAHSNMLTVELKRATHLLLSAALHCEHLQGKKRKDTPIKPGERLTVDETRRLVTIRGEQIKLSENRFKLFHYLYQRTGTVVTRQELGEATWGKGYDAEKRSGINLLNTTMLRLRDQIEEDASKPKIILTEPGGYKLSS